MDTDQHTYRSYLLRLWRSKSDDTLSWYASLEDPVSGERKGFSDLRSMIEYLETETATEHKDHLNPISSSSEEQQ